MKTSARNQFQGSISQVKTGAVNDEVEIELAGGQRIVAIVTHDSTVNLGLTVGAQAFALIKASSIILVTDTEGARFSARNQLTGTITQVVTGAVNTEVVIEVAGGVTLAVIVTNTSSSNLALAAGGAVTALFKASSVIVGVPA